MINDLLPMTNVFAIALKQKQYKTYILSDETANSTLEVVPERGGIATSWLVEGKEIFYLDAERFANPDLTVRGGVPILFPLLTPARIRRPLLLVLGLLATVLLGAPAAHASPQPPVPGIHQLQAASSIQAQEVDYSIGGVLRGVDGVARPIAYAPELEKAQVPQIPDIVAAARRLAKLGAA